MLWCNGGMYNASSIVENMLIPVCVVHSHCNSSCCCDGGLDFICNDGSEPGFRTFDNYNCTVSLC